ncbi:MAG: sugar transferase [Candidatus Gracilibacteria bacterium]|jgi:exopolysaccharide biosynthesis polyprenyl glycosylphosphotransferase
MKRSEIAFGLLRIPVDFTMVVLGFLLGYKLRLMGDFIPGRDFEVMPANFLPPEEYLEFGLLFGLMLVGVFAFFGLYRMRNTAKALTETRHVFTHSLVWMLLIMAYFFLTRELFFSRLVLIFGAVLSVIFMIVARLVLRQIELLFLNADIGRRRILLIGANKITDKLAKKLRKDPHYTVVGYLTEGSARIENAKMLGSLKELKRITKRNKVEVILQTSQELSEVQDHEILQFCQEHHLEYRFVPDILAVERSNIEIQTIGGYPIIHLKPTPLDGWGRIYKRSVDLALSSVALLLLSPVFLGIAIGVKLDSKGPIIFSKLEDGSPAYRIGQVGDRFKFYKFRTMQHNTHHLRYSDLAEKNHRKGPLMKIKNDPRITPFGKFLRKTSLDELPNLWSVLKGDMSLVGPRPHLPEEVEKYEQRHHFLLTIKPGITGLSQTSGRSDLDFEEEVRLDSTYIKHWSPWMDFKIILKTFWVVLRGKAAD